MASVSHLKATILAVLNSSEAQDGNQQFFEELMSNKQNLLRVFDVGSRNPQEQRELENGRILIDGRSLAVNKDFARQVVFISEQLEVSERHVAGLLQDVMVSTPNVTGEKAIEATILEFHSRRRQLTDCLRYLFEASVVAQNSNSPPLYNQIDLFLQQHILSHENFARAVFVETQRLGNLITKARVARQNARSETVVPSQQGGQLGFDVLSARHDSLQYERRNLATVLYLLGRLGRLAPPEIKTLVMWLQQFPAHSLVYYFLPTLLACFDVVDPQSKIGSSRYLLATNEDLIRTLKTILAPASEWTDTGLKSVILLKWTLFMTDVRHRNPALEDRDGFRADELESQIWNAVHGDCFLYAARTIATLFSKHGAHPPISYATVLLPKLDQDPSTELPPDDFKPTILEAFEALVRLLITHASSELRKIKQRQEDVLLANARSERTRTTSRVPPTTNRHSAAPSDPVPAGVARNDIAMLFSLIGILYSSLPAERALQFWGGGLGEGQQPTYLAYLESTAGKLPSFLKWAVWSTQPRDLEMMTALYDMLTGLANGQQCSELAHNFLARGGNDDATANVGSAAPVSWTAIFTLLEQWQIAAATPRPQPQQQGVGMQPGVSAMQPQRAHHHQAFVLTQRDVLFAQSFLRLLAVVVTNSVAVRLAISGHGRFRAIPSLASLIPLSIPLELKGAIFEVLAAFALPGAGSAGIEICKSIWTLMERYEIINVRGSLGVATATPPVKGLEVELEEVESVHKLYPETIPFLQLLATLIHTPKSVPLADNASDAEPMNTIPDAMGHPYRQIGISPYISFVIDHVFARISQREYLQPGDRWRMNDLCLCFVERCLASFDLESLVASPEDQATGPVALMRLASQPGHDIMKRMLTQSGLQNAILSYIVEGLDGFDKGFPEQQPYFRSTIVRVLRIVLRVLEIQDIFLDVFVPLLSAVDDAASLIGEVHPVSYYIRFDQSLFYGSAHIPTIAAYIAYPKYPELQLLSVKILDALATPSTVSQLSVIIDRSGESDRILDGYLSVMDSEAVTEVEEARHIAETSTGAGASDVDETSDALTQAIKLAVLDFFVQNTQPDRPYPNVAHLLLFGKAVTEDQIQDPGALGARRACVHSIIDMVNRGVPRIKTKGKRRQASGALDQALLITSPGLAERCYQIIYQLCKHPRTSEFSMRYLRSREDFFARHLAVLPFKAPACTSTSGIEVLYSDGSRVLTNAPALCAFLRLRSTIFDLIALELHILTTKGHLKSVSEVLNLLYGNEEGIDDEPVAWEDELFQPFHEIGQSHARLIEHLQSLDFDWADGMAVTPVTLDLFSQLNIQGCIRPDDFGCEVVDRSALLTLLHSARRAVQGGNRVLTAAQSQQLTAETEYILGSCVVENNRRRVLHASAECYESWRRLLDMTLMKCFDRIPQERREGLLFDLLHALPNTLRSPNTQDGTAAILSEVTLSALTKLREDRHRYLLLRASTTSLEASNLPAERLFAFLRSLVQCILDSSRNELVRGNLYASLVNYVHLVTDVEEIPTEISAQSLAQSVSAWSGSTARIGEPSSAEEAARSTKLHLATNSVQILKPATERLVALISRDAIDGAEVWKTVSFIVLDSLVRLSAFERQPVILTSLSRPGYLAGFIQGLKESDARLQEVLKPDPDDLNSLYVYEAKMSLLARMSQTRAGAERLLESRLIPILSDCDFLDTRPEIDQAFIDRDAFLPSAVQRYHQLLLPALQVITGVLATLGSKHASASHQALEFLKSHRDTAILLMKNETDELSLSSVEEMRLLVCLSTHVLPLISKSELLSSGGFGGIHNAVLNLAARTLGDRYWSNAVRPSSEDEMVDASVKEPAYGQTKFRVKLQKKDMDLRKALVVYLGAASSFTEHEFSAVLSPAITTKHEEGSTRIMAVIPSVGDAIDALNYVHDGLSQTLKQFLDFSAELASKDHAMENIPEIFNIPESISFESLDVPQRQALINNELQRWQTDARARAHVLFQLLEMLLLLVWRHLGVYGAEDRPVDIHNLNMSIRLVPSFDVSTFRAEAGRKLGPVLHRMTTMARETLGLGWQSYEKYMEIMSQRLMDTAGLHDTNEEEEMSSESP